MNEVATAFLDEPYLYEILIVYVLAAELIYFRLLDSYREDCMSWYIPSDRRNKLRVYSWLFPITIPSMIIHKLFKKFFGGINV